MAYRVDVRRAVRKQMLRLSKDARVQVAETVDNLAEEPRPDGCRKLRESGLWRVRKGWYRVVYSIDDESRVVTLVKVPMRREDTYKGS